VGATSADVVAVEARRAAERRQPTSGPPEEPAGAVAGPVLRPAVASLTERRLRALPEDDRPLPDVSVYDSLLGGASERPGGAS